MDAAVALSALGAGVVAVLVTVAIERLGGVRGGVLGTIPTTIVPASLGFWAAAPEQAAFERALLVTPLGMLLNAGFLLGWRVLPPRLPARWPLGARLALVVAGTLAGWALGASALVLGLERLRAAGGTGVLGPSPWASPWPPALLATGLLVGLGVLACARRPPGPRGARAAGPLVLVLRGLLAALAIGAAVSLARGGHGLLAGVASVFPAIFLTTMVALWLAQGEAVPLGAVGPMALGSTAVAAYALAFAALAPRLGPAPAAAAAWALAVAGASWPAARWLGRRARPGDGWPAPAPAAAGA